MPTVERSDPSAFAVWITGLPGSGKSTLARALKAKLAECGINAAVLESDSLRRVADLSSYDEQGRDSFYRLMAYIGTLLTDHGVPVIFDATARRRLFRDRARELIARFLEIYVDTPLATCIERDPKGIYRQAQEGKARNVPGLQEAYEPPQSPDVLIHGNADLPEASAARVIAKLTEKGYI